MKDAADNQTGDLIPVKRGRGRPPKGDAAMTNAERQAAYRARNNLVPFTVELPADLVEQFEAYRQFKNVTRSEIIAKLLRSQLLRKR